MIGRNVSILKGVEIGDNTIIALGSIVTKNTPPNSVIAGAPARVICGLDEYFEKRKQKQSGEAIEYAKSMIAKDYTPCIEDFSEEWCLFLTKDENFSNPIVRQKVDYRLKGYVDINEFLSRKRPFNGFRSFIDYVSNDKKNKFLKFFFPMPS